MLDQTEFKHMPKLKPCPKCGAALEYLDTDFAACTSKHCAFSQEIPDKDDEEE